MASVLKGLGYVAAFLAGAGLVAVPGFILMGHLIVSVPLAEMSLIKADIQLLKNSGMQQDARFEHTRKFHCLMLGVSLQNLQTFNQWQLPWFRFEKSEVQRKDADETHRMLKDPAYCSAADYQYYLNNLKTLQLDPLQ